MANRRTTTWSFAIALGLAVVASMALQPRPAGAQAGFGEFQGPEAEAPAPAPAPPPAPAPAYTPAPAPVPATGTFRDCPTCPEMVVIPAGTFMMGSPTSEEGRWDDESPQHSVTLGRFAISSHEITLGQFRQFVQATGRDISSYCSGLMVNGNYERTASLSWQSPGFLQAVDHPVVCVSWEDARAYAEWLTRATGHTYRLPSEAEWEYATRAGTTSPYYWGWSFGPEACQYENVSDQSFRDGFAALTYAGRCNDYYVFTAPVGSFRPNTYGLFDTLANTDEWVEDCWNPSHVGAPANGGARETGDCSQRVIRGSSWGGSHRLARSAARNQSAPTYRYNDTGFRLVREF
ncbi:MAG: formylglycine-generating enzyme family protein [Rhodospirillaceae bacterium]|nr:formylglycine-generating enzyme family protein [Rhodospirillaceae bacterium]